jgi:hypothetical protein
MESAVKKLAATLFSAAALAVSPFVTATAAHADCRDCGIGGPIVDPRGPVGVGGLGPVVGPVGPWGVGGLGPVAGPLGPVGVGGVLGPVGVDPLVDAAVHPYYAIPYGYPLVADYPGEVPCLTPDGMPYYTPADYPCLCFADTGAVVPC